MPGFSFQAGGHGQQAVKWNSFVKKNLAKAGKKACIPMTLDSCCQQNAIKDPKRLNEKDPFYPRRMKMARRLGES